jgi:hypothetical protein
MNQADTPTPGQRRHDRGSALLITAVLLFIVSAVGMNTLRTTEYDQRVAGYQKQGQIAFYAAEAAVADARAVVRDMAGRAELPEYPADFPNEGTPEEISTASDFPGSPRPKFYVDPDVTNPISYMGEGASCTEGCNMNIGATKYNHTRWKINVVGEAPSGDEQRIEVVVLRLLAVGY